jgi:hypothetical protein
MNLRKDTSLELILSWMRMINLLTDPQSISNRWKNCFNQVLNVHGVLDARQMNIHTADPSVPEPSLVEVETATVKLRSYKSPGID